MTYSPFKRDSGAWTVIDEHANALVAAPLSEIAANKIADRWNSAPKVRMVAGPASNYSDSETLRLMSQMEKYRFVIPAKRQADWRGRDEKGSLPSLGIHSCILVATDGIVAYFVLGDDETLFYGHLAAFEETKDECTAVRVSSPSRPKSIRQRVLDEL